MEINSQHHGYLGNGKARKIHYESRKSPMPMINHDQEPHAYTMHAKNSEENIHVTQYLQSNPDIDVDPDVHLWFPALIFPSCSKLPNIHTLQECSKKTLSIQEYERERIMREIQKYTDKRYQLVLLILFIDETFILFIFHCFPSFSSSRETCDLSPPFSPIFHYFHK